MTSYLHVLNTYAWRWRFWIFGGLYVYVGWLVAHASDHPAARGRTTDALAHLQMIFISTIVAFLLMAFLALHVRRQFGTPQAHVMPGFFAPHFGMFVFTSSLAWIVAPVLIAWRCGLPVLPFISGHACAAIFLGLVVIWPGAMMLLVAAFFAPALFAQTSSISRASQLRFAENFVSGQLGGLYFALFALAAAAYVGAAWRLRRLSDLSAATSDDFSLEIKNDAYTNRGAFKLLENLRDLATERRLAATMHAREGVGVRRIPSAASFGELALYGLIILAIAPLAWYLFGAPEAGMFVVTVGSAIMVFGPLSTWRFRLNALAPEVLKPTTRRDAIRRVVLAMGMDFLIWGAAASLVVVCGYLLMIGQRGFAYPSSVSTHLLAMWGAIVLIYGITLATMRFRYWVPLFLGLIPGTMVSCLLLALLFVQLADPGRNMRRDDWRFAIQVSARFAVCCAAIGLVLSRYSYRRLLEADLR
jgi:hypothetical protein